jgi:predicted RNase H-like nuclease
MVEVTNPGLKEKLREVVPETLFGEIFLSETKRTPKVREVVLGSMRSIMAKVQA